MRIQKQLEQSQLTLRNDFNAWYKVMQKQQTAQNPMEMTTDSKVKEDLQAFYKARDQIYSKIGPQ